MKVDITSMFFNSQIEGKTATPAWGTSIGQSASKQCRIETTKEGVIDFLVGMTYKLRTDVENLDISRGSKDRELMMFSIFDKVYINNKLLDDSTYTIILIRELSQSHNGRLIISYAPYIKYRGVENVASIEKMREKLGCSSNGCWFVYDISIINQDELHFSAIVVDNNAPKIYKGTSQERSREWNSMIDLETGAAKSYTDLDESKPLQQIFYGAPGTGKSFGTDGEIHKIYPKKSEEEKKYVFRTTFHPDSDYSTFVGCYKPTKEEKGDKSRSLLGKDELVAKLKEYRTLYDETMAQTQFGYDYYEELRRSTELADIIKEAGVKTFDTAIRIGMSLAERCTPKARQSSITYAFTPQAFTKAYIAAWESVLKGENKPVFLVIEEINRGNCAQIFGDIFQLLDRNENGRSSYPIKPDTDLGIFIGEQLGNLADENPDLRSIATGEEMLLPENLHIRATMNTSDQSLFPIDSAFKRRWDWKYVPIDYDKETWSIEAKGVQYSWSDFLKKMNGLVASTTDSEDKMLGFYFAKAKNGIIDADTFVGKVVFYLWNDVFKDYGLPKEILNGAESKEFAFRNFFMVDGHANEDMVKRLLDNLGVEIVEATENETYIENDTIDAGKAEHKETLVAVTINGEKITADGTTQFDLYLNAIKKIGVDRVGPTLEAMKYRRKGSPMATKSQVQSLLESANYSYVEADGYYFVKGANGYTLVRILEDLNRSLNLNIQIDYK